MGHQQNAKKITALDVPGVLAELRPEFGIMLLHKSVGLRLAPHVEGIMGVLLPPSLPIASSRNVGYGSVVEAAVRLPTPPYLVHVTWYLVVIQPYRTVCGLHRSN